MRQLVLALLIALVVWCPPAAAAQEPPPAQAPAPAEASGEEAPVVVFNRTITTFRAPLFGIAPADRARRTAGQLRELLEKLPGADIRVDAQPQGNVVLVDGQMALIITPDDADRLRGETLQQATDTAVSQLRVVIAETAESRDRARLLQEVGNVLVATVVLLVFLVGLWFTRAWLTARLAAAAERLAQRTTVGGTRIVTTARLQPVVRLAIGVTVWLLSVLAVYRWVSYALSQFPYTRPWGEQLRSYLANTLAGLLVQAAGAMPDLIVAIVIFLVARGVIGLFQPVFDRAARGFRTVSWLDADTARPTERIFRIAIWLFAIVMAYPYLPGSDSDAFKGVSVFVGLMISIGGSNLFGQGASGLILMYSRTLRPGEYVRIADTEGTVTEMGAYTLKIRTGLGEEVTLPNALVLGNVVKNYSRTVHGTGFIVDTVVTIGYDAPWRQVHAMLLEAARRTDGVVESPEPRVFQTALTDFYPEYRLVCQAIPRDPRPRAQVLADLHAHIQDVFNEHGVQIMSPHYLGDPSEAKVVPKSKWFTAPAKEPGQRT